MTQFLFTKNILIAKNTRGIVVWIEDKPEQITAGEIKAVDAIFHV